MMIHGEEPRNVSEIKVSFGYQCSLENKSKCLDIPSAAKLKRASSSFSSLTGAALSANTTLADTSICNGLIASEILPSLDSPRSFRRIPSSQKLDFLLSSSLQSSSSNLSCSPSDSDTFSLESTLTPSKSEGFLNTMDLHIAGGAAGEDRVQAVCSEVNGWLFCAIYDGFNGRDAADFLAGTFYETITSHLSMLEWDWENQQNDAENVLGSLQNALNRAEADFLHMVEREMDERPDLVCIGSCVLIALFHGDNLYVLNVGDSRAVLATYGEVLRAVQLTDSHTVDSEAERIQILNEHPEDSSVIIGRKVKGKLKVTRAFGVGYLKRADMNDCLMGILRIQKLISPPYISLQPSLRWHKVSNSDQFLVLASDGLFDFFSNEEVVKLVHSYISENDSSGDPAMYLVEQLTSRAADSAGMSMEELMNIPAGRRRKYHDDVTVIVIFLSSSSRSSMNIRKTSKASASSASCVKAV